jgi:hypothetical protein
VSRRIGRKGGVVVTNSGSVQTNPEKRCLKAADNISNAVIDDQKRLFYLSREKGSRIA